jgi:hypothetical protein
MIGFFEKKTSNIPVDNGSSLNIPITIEIIALTNRTLIETSVLLVVCLLIYYLIFNPPLLLLLSYAPLVAIRNLPAIPVNLIEYSPNDQNTLKLFPLLSVPISIFRLISLY